MTKKSDQKEILDRIMKMPVSEKDLVQYGISLELEGKITKADLIMFQLVERGCSGDLSAIREINDRLLGKPTQHIEAKVEQVTYYDFLMGLAEKDEKKKLGLPQKTIEVTPELPHDGSDLLEDLG